MVARGATMVAARSLRGALAPPAIRQIMKGPDFGSDALPRAHGIRRVECKGVKPPGHSSSGIYSNSVVSLAFLLAIEIALRVRHERDTA